MKKEVLVQKHLESVLKPVKSLVKEAYDLAQQALTAAGAAQEYTEDVLKDLFGGTLPDKTLANNSPEVIQRAAHLGLGANFWSVGDKIGIKLNGTVGLLTFYNETYYAFIIGFNHNAGLEGGNGIDFQFGKTSDGKDTAFVDSEYGSTDYDTFAPGFKIDNANYLNGWSGSYMRNTVCPMFLAALPADWQKIIAPCIKYSDNIGGLGGGAGAKGNVTSTEDKIWLLAEFEVFGAQRGANPAEQDYQKQYDYYKNGNSTVKHRHSADSTACDWWLRSVCYFSSDNPILRFILVLANGNEAYDGICISYGFAPGFKVA